MTWTRDDDTITDEPDAVDRPALLRLLDATSWAGDRPHERTLAALERSLCFSVRHAGAFVGFGRVVSDGAVYAVVQDVVIDPGHRRRGLGRWLLRTMLAHPAVTGLRVVLWTTDQPEFYQACGLRREPAFHLLGSTPVWSRRTP